MRRGCPRRRIVLSQDEASTQHRKRLGKETHLSSHVGGCTISTRTFLAAIHADIRGIYQTMTKQDQIRPNMTKNQDITTYTNIQRRSNRTATIQDKQCEELRFFTDLRQQCLRWMSTSAGSKGYVMRSDLFVTLAGLMIPAGKMCRAPVGDPVRLSDALDFVSCWTHLILSGCQTHLILSDCQMHLMSAVHPRCQSVLSIIWGLFAFSAGTQRGILSDCQTHVVLAASSRRCHQSRQRVF